YIEPCRLAGHNYNIPVPTVLSNSCQLRSCAGIHIPQVMMDALEMPTPLSGSCIQRDDGRAEEIGARTIDPIEIVSRRSERNVGNPAPRINLHLAPVINTADVFPRILWPGVITKLARTRDGVERPRQ